MFLGKIYILYEIFDTSFFQILKFCGVSVVTVTRLRVVQYVPQFES